MYIVTVLDEQLKPINSYHEDVKPTPAMKLDILNRYEDGKYIRVQEIETETDIQNEPQPTQGGTL